MKGIYLTQEGKQEIEAKIAELEDYTYDTQDLHLEGNIQGHLYCLKEILSSATILPVEESWENADKKSDYGLSSKEFYPQGVVICKK
jgi:hypothetical protein